VVSRRLVVVVSGMLEPSHIGLNHQRGGQLYVDKLAITTVPALGAVLVELLMSSTGYDEP